MCACPIKSSACVDEVQMEASVAVLASCSDVATHWVFVAKTVAACAAAAEKLVDRAAHS